jgi:hypothetical protein
VIGAPGVTRTPGTQFRKLLLYPPELRGREGYRDAAASFYRYVPVCVCLAWSPAGRQIAPTNYRTLRRHLAEHKQRL